MANGQEQDPCPVAATSNQHEATGGRQVSIYSKAYKSKARCRKAWVQRTGLEGERDSSQTLVLPY